MSYRFGLIYFAEAGLKSVPAALRFILSNEERHTAMWAWNFKVGAKRMLKKDTAIRRVIEAPSGIEPNIIGKHHHASGSSADVGPGLFNNA